MNILQLIKNKSGKFHYPNLYTKKVMTFLPRDIKNRVNRGEFCPEMRTLAGHGHFVFQQDGARAHTARDTIEFLKDAVPELL